MSASKLTLRVNRLILKLFNNTSFCGCCTMAVEWKYTSTSLMMSKKRFRKKQPWPISRYYTSIHL